MSTSQKKDAEKNEFLNMPMGTGTAAEPAAIEKATPPGGAITAPARQWFDPSDEIEQDERVVPYSKLTQSSSNAFKLDHTAEIGDIVSSLGINYGKEITIIPMWYKRQAAKFNKQRERECFSMDGVTGVTYGECAKCPYNYAVWPTDERGKRTPPLCSRIMSFPAIVLKSEAFPEGDMDSLGSLGVVSMQFMSTSEPVGRQIASVQAAFHQPYYSHAWRVWSKDKTSGGNTYRVYLAQQAQKVPLEIMQRVEALCHEWAGATIQIGADDGQVATSEAGARPEDF